MSTDQNKAVVRRFMTEVLAGGKIDLVDELCAPNYVNRIMGADLATFKAMLAAMEGAQQMRFEIENLMAEGDAVVARFTIEATNKGTGKKISARGLTYFGLANGRIVEDDPFSNKDLMQELGVQPPPAP
jgi:ketosteroid isomerase-like protein